MRRVQNSEILYLLMYMFVFTVNMISCHNNCIRLINCNGDCTRILKDGNQVVNCQANYSVDHSVVHW